ncbi:DUF6199 family natural product biosynthesis protein [Saccharibacillus qingshengii]|uniref:DUF6199 family natural product biosynthesis protein n=1 Tax=Saccharibacillus qingshengii TaxID=1763540 RepID=UPI001557C6CE|nr:DUF6199 family natural product biosynthesis protein [Saccharibacillus qingshengii]
MFLLFLILVAVGAVNVLAPQWIWRRRYGQTGSDHNRPTPAPITWSRLAGMAALLAALLLLVNGL